MFEVVQSGTVKSYCKFYLMQEWLPAAILEVEEAVEEKMAETMNILIRRVKNSLNDRNTLKGEIKAMVTR